MPTLSTPTAPPADPKSAFAALQHGQSIRSATLREIAKPASIPRDAAPRLTPTAAVPGAVAMLADLSPSTLLIREQIIALLRGSIGVLSKPAGFTAFQATVMSFADTVETHVPYTMCHEITGDLLRTVPSETTRGLAGLRAAVQSLREQKPTSASLDLLVFSDGKFWDLPLREGDTPDVTPLRNLGAEAKDLGIRVFGAYLEGSEKADHLEVFCTAADGRYMHSAKIEDIQQAFLTHSRRLAS